MKKLPTLALIILTGTSLTIWAKPVDRIMKKLDTDGDGMISIDEFEPPRRHGRLERLDVNDDGAVTMDEVNQHAEERKAEMAERQAEMLARIETFFTEADTNQDGMVTQDEAETAAFSRIDEDGDGYLTEDEIRNAHANRENNGGHRGKRHGKKGRWGHGGS